MRWRKWIWLILWIISLVGISFYGGAVSYGFFFALTLLPIISFVYLLCVYLRFKIYQEVESRDMICGQAIPYYFMLRNEDYFGFAGVNVRMYPHFSYVENMPDDIEYELLPGEEVVHRTKITCKYRGEYEVGLKEVIVTDFFRIFRFRYKVVGTIKAIVHPKLVEVEEITALPEITDILPRESAVAQSEPDVVVRDYISGDSLRRVHWKASARSGQLKVRKDVGEEKRGITVFLDTKRYGKTMEEYLPLESKMLEVILALGMFFAKRDMVVSVCYGQRGIRRADVHGVRSFEDFYGRISEIVFDGDENPMLLLQTLYQGGGLSDSKAVIGIVHKIDDEMLQLTERISSGGSAVLLYVVSDEELGEYVRQSTSRRKIIVIPTEAEPEGLL